MATLPLKAPYTEQTYWNRRTMTTGTNSQGRKYSDCSIYSWYTSDRDEEDGDSAGNVGSGYVTGWTYHDMPTRLFVDVDDMWHLIVRLVFLPEMNTILVKNIIGWDWLRKQRVNMDLIRWDKSRRQKGKPTVFGSYALLWDVEDMIHSLYGEHVHVELFSDHTLNRLKKQHVQRLTEQMMSAMPALNGHLNRDEIYEITKHMTPSWFAGVQ